jgi:hypothetical protein
MNTFDECFYITSRSRDGRSNWVFWRTKISSYTGFFSFMVLK